MDFERFIGHILGDRFLKQAILFGLRLAKAIEKDRTAADTKQQKREPKRAPASINGLGKVVEQRDNEKGKEQPAIARPI